MPDPDTDDPNDSTTDYESGVDDITDDVMTGSDDGEEGQD